MLLPDQIAALGAHLNLDRGQLFRKYLIAELFTPNVESAPAFILSPVKADAEGARHADFLSDRNYARLSHQYCIFRDQDALSCRVHSKKPFGCNLLICGKMTGAKPLMLNKTYYYHKWLPTQGILFDLFPSLEGLYRILLDTVSCLPDDREEREAALHRGNEIIGGEMARMMNGRRAEGRLFYV